MNYLFKILLKKLILNNLIMNTPSRLSNLSMHSANTTTSHNVERIAALAEKLTIIQVNNLNIGYKFIINFKI
jgi:hypothetical protein